MKAILLLLSSLVVVVGVFLCGVVASAYYLAEPEAHKFAHLDTPDLWTSEPVEVDPKKQSYERVAGPALVADVPASDVPKDQRGPDNALASTGNATPAMQQVASTDAAVAGSAVPAVPAVDTAQADFCYARYRSYRIEDNSYQPFDGGPRRQCEAPGLTSADRSIASSQAPQNNGAEAQTVAAVAETDRLPMQSAAQNDVSAMSAGVSGSHAEWCLARYRSYRTDDNSYQPFDGGPRKTCQSPFG